MAELEIMSLKPEYQKMVMNNQQKYNPNFDSKLDEDEIGILLADSGKNAPDDLMIETNKSKTVEEAKDLPTLAFKDLDLNEDGEVTEDELKAYKDYLQLKQINVKNKEEKSRINKDAIGRVFITMFSAAAGLGGGSALTKKLLPFTDKYFWRYDKSLTKLGANITMLGGVVAAGLLGFAGYKIARHFIPAESKENKKLMKSTLKNEKKQIKELDKQYKYINAKREAEEQRRAEQQSRQQKSGDDNIVKDIMFWNMWFRSFD